MHKERRVRMLLTLATISPLLFWIVRYNSHWSVAWWWGLVLPFLLTGVALRSVTRHHVPHRRQFLVLTALVLGLWTAMGIGALVQADSTCEQPVTATSSNAARARSC